MGASVVETPHIMQWAVDRIWQWSAVCGHFLEWEREHMILREPSAEDLAEHKQALRLLEQITRLYHATVSNPEFPDRKLAKELEGRLIQLDHSWRAFHDALPKEEAEKLLAEVFPDEP